VSSSTVSLFLLYLPSSRLFMLSYILSKTSLGVHHLFTVQYSVHCTDAQHAMFPHFTVQYPVHCTDAQHTMSPHFTVQYTAQMRNTPCPHTSLYSTLYTAQTRNTPCSHTSCKVHCSQRWNFRKHIILGKLYQLCHLNNKYRY
jgi:hypothetical protein